jgi:arylsulfatase A-like enzyme
VVAVAAGIAASALAGARVDGASAAPNILVIVTDDQRANTLGVMPETRRVFYKKGRAFGRAYVTTPLCCPSRASIFTGLFAHNHGVHSNETSDLPQSLTVQRYLQDAGYRTAVVGKYLNSWALVKNPPYFDRWAIIRPDSYRNPEFNVNGEVRQIPGYSTNIVTQRAVEFLHEFESQDDQPWFLYVAPVAPHLPAVPAPQYAHAPVPDWHPGPAVREKNRSDKPPWIRSTKVPLKAVGNTRRRMLRTLMSVDALTARVFDALRDLREGHDTLAIFLSDNGYSWGEHGMAGKRTPYLETVHVPLAVRWPGHVSPGSVDTRTATNVDLAPTMLGAAGVTPLQPMDGIPLLDRSWRRNRLFTEHWGNLGIKRPDWAAIRTRRYQYIESYDDTRENVVFREYYDLKHDPNELVNLLHDGNPRNDPDFSRASSLVGKYSTCAGETCPGGLRDSSP